MKKVNLGLRAALAIIFGVPVVGAMIFLPAWSFDYWEGWAFLEILFTPMAFFLAYMLKYKRELMERRLKMKEKRKTQANVQLFNMILFLTSITIAGLDNRFNWSPMPLSFKIFSQAMMFFGYLMFMKTMLHNEYASRVIEIQEGQKLVDTGPYAVVRHPMYTAAILMYIFIPLALGSFWAVIPLLFLPISIIIRIFDEEKALIDSLDGYADYMKRVRYRLIPYIW
ncbi:methyltransferase family protein [Candidatus Margulisiibacteriota bacterium]